MSRASSSPGRAGLCGAGLAALVAGLALAPPAFAQSGSAPSGWRQSLEGKIGHVTGTLEPRFTLDEPRPSGDAPSGAGGAGAPEGGEAGKGSAEASAGGIDPANRDHAALILEWLRVAEPAPNATEGARFRYSNSGAMVGTTRDGGIITARHDPPAPDPVWLWTNRRGLDSVDHCTMEEYVTARAGGGSIAGCAGRHRGDGAVAAGAGPGGEGAGSAAEAALAGTWEFGRADGTVLCTITLGGEAGAHGKVIRACHPNESFWTLEGDVLVFLDSSGRVTSRLSRAREGDWTGPYVLEPQRRITHYIRRGAGAAEPGTGADAGTAAGGGPVAAAFEPGIDRMGGDYRSFDLDAPDPRLCEARCLAEDRCRAWTYVVPGHQGPSARCWLKSVVPAPRQSECCTSGVKGGAGETAADASSPQAGAAREPAADEGASGHPSYFVGVWALDERACAGGARASRQTGEPGGIGDAIVQGIGEGLEQAFLAVALRFAADGTYSMVNLASGEETRAGSWSFEGDILATNSETEGIESGAVRVAERLPGRFDVVDVESQSGASFWRCEGR